MRDRIQRILQSRLSGGQTYFDLPLTTRILLVTDGTVTELLEALVGEPIGIGVKIQKIDSTLNILNRHITLRGEISGFEWLYAESAIHYKRLNAAARHALMEDDAPIGSILNSEFPDNHRKILDCGFQINQDAARQLKLEANYEFLYRKYQILIKQDPIMTISEWFPVKRIDQAIFGNEKNGVR